jgi:hypothetical protein
MLRAVEFDNRYSIAHFKTNILVAHSLSPVSILVSLPRLHIRSPPTAANPSPFHHCVSSDSTGIITKGYTFASHTKTRF